jgi:plasmid stabilization system protein ParE
VSELSLVVRPEVDADLLEAEAWYNDQEPGLGQKFLKDALETIDRLLQNPFLHHVRYRKRRVRWAYTRRFPYRVVFSVMGETVVVYAVIHGARHDRNWKARVE